MAGSAAALDASSSLADESVEANQAMNANGVAPLPLEQSPQTLRDEGFERALRQHRRRPQSFVIIRGVAIAIGPVASPPWSTNTSWSGSPPRTRARAKQAGAARRQGLASREVTKTTATRPARVASPIASPASIDPTSEPSSRDAPDAGTSAAPVAGDAHAMSARHHSEAAAASVAPSPRVLSGAVRRSNLHGGEGLSSRNRQVSFALFASRRE